MPRRTRNPSTSAPQLKSQRAIAYAANVYSSVSRHSMAAKGLARWMHEFNSNFGFDFELTDEDAEEIEFALSPRGRKLPSPAMWSAIGKQLGSPRRANPLSVQLLDPRVVQLAQDMNFGTADTAILQLIIDYTVSKVTEDLMDALSTARGEPHRLSFDAMQISMMTGIDEAIVSHSLLPTGALRSAGLIGVHEGHGVQVLKRLVRVMKDPEAPLETLRSRLLGPQQAATLTLDAFTHMGQDIERVLNILSASVASGDRGVIVILHGPPGTGKTELAKTLAAAVGVPLFAVGDTDSDGGEPTRTERLEELRLAQRLLVGASPALLLLDEAEDLFGDALDFSGVFGLPRRQGSRRFLHQTLEEGVRPVIMTANSLARFGEPVLRRTTCCLEVKIPPACVRVAMWQKAAEAEGVAMTEAQLSRLGRELPASPALARSAMRAGRWAGGRPEDVTWAIGGMLSAMGKRHAIVEADSSETYDPELISTDLDLRDLVERLAAPGVRRGFSLLLSGVSGGGKTEFCRHLADRLGMEVMQRRASDILGPYVGETEKATARAFREAADNNAVLLLDEIDALIRDRRSAQRGWEVSQVNELLSWLEPGRLKTPVCATTNLIEDLDPAAIRRFTFKVTFSWLSPFQVELAFRRILGCEPPTGVRSLTRLCPADFTLVRRNAEYQGTLGDPKALLAALEREQAAKRGTSNPIGFSV